MYFMQLHAIKWAQWKHPVHKQRKKEQSCFEHTALHQRDGSKCHSAVVAVINRLFHGELSVCGLYCPDFCSSSGSREMIFFLLDECTSFVLHRSWRGRTDTEKHWNWKPQIAVGGGGVETFCWRPFVNRNTGSVRGAVPVTLGVPSSQQKL